MRATNEHHRLCLHRRCCPLPTLPNLQLLTFFPSSLCSTSQRGSPCPQTAIRRAAQSPQDMPAAAARRRRCRLLPPVLRRCASWLPTTCSASRGRLGARAARQEGLEVREVWSGRQGRGAALGEHRQAGRDCSVIDLAASNEDGWRVAVRLPPVRCTDAAALSGKRNRQFAAHVVWAAS